ncbi:MAG: hypothetical protein ABIW33_03940 [Sphingomicrobium sp.]
MDNILLALTAAVIVVLVHFAVVDFRFRVAGGMAGIWGQNPAPPVLWLVRLTLVPPLLAALCIGAFGPSSALWIALAVFVAVHLGSLLFLKAFPLD